MDTAMGSSEYAIDLEEFELPDEARISRVVNAIQTKKELEGSYNDHSDSHSDGYGIMF